MILAVYRLNEPLPAVDAVTGSSYMAVMTETSQHRRKKLRIRAWRRGFKEADLILGRFADANLESMSDEMVEAFEELLDQPDQDIYAWIIGREPVPDDYRGELMEALQAFDVGSDAAFGDGPGPASR